MTDSDRRKKKRFVQKKTPFEHYDIVDLDNNTKYGELLDISEGGVKLETPMYIKAGTMITAKIELPYKYLSKTAITLNIICRWCAEIGGKGLFEAGFEFIDNNAIDSVIIAKIISLSKKERIILTLLNSDLNFE